MNYNIFLIFFLFFSFDFQTKRQYSVRNTVEDIQDELMFLGSFYNMEIELNDFYVVDQLHNILEDMYNGSYNIEKLMDRVFKKTKLKSFHPFYIFPLFSL